MKNKIILFFLLIFVLVSLGAVSAADIDDAVLADDGASDIYVSPLGGGEMTPTLELQTVLMQQ